VKNYTTERIYSQPIASFPNFQNSNLESYEKSPALDHSFCFAQQLAPLTVEEIMRDPKWIGVAPSNLTWAEDSKLMVAIGVQASIALWAEKI
jgi:hypothetical protein